MEKRIKSPEIVHSHPFPLPLFPFFFGIFWLLGRVD